MIPIAILGIPIFYGGLLFIFKGPIQKGFFLSNSTLGPLLNHIFPPSDLYDPLAEVEINKNKSEYSLLFSHKYVGNHALFIHTKRISDNGHLNQADISYKVTVYDNHQEIFKREQKHFSCFERIGESLNIVLWYTVPIELPVKNKLEAKIELDGNLKNFFSDHRSPKFLIKKVSDL